MKTLLHCTTAPKAACLLAISLLCLLGSLHYAFVILPPAAALSGPGIVPDLYPAWCASRAVLFHHQDPYSSEVTREIQSTMYRGRRASQNEQRFAYPLFAVLLLAPFAALPFPAAQVAFLLVAALLTAWSALAWTDRIRAPVSRIVCVVLLLATFPVMLGLELRQPTMLVAALLAGTVACIRSGRLVSAGVLGALATVKPQLAIGVLLPLLLWSLSDWRNRKIFLWSLGWTMGGLLGISQWILPGWPLRWLATLRAYTHYAGAPALIRFLPGSRLPLLAGTLLVGAAIVTSWRWRRSDPLFAIGFSVSALQVLLPFQLYNEVMLLPAVLWMLGRRSPCTTPAEKLLRYLLWGLLGAGWLSTCVLCVAHAISPSSIARAWSLPIVIAWAFPIVLLACYVVCAIADAPAVSVAPSPSDDPSSAVGFPALTVCPPGGM